MKKHAWTPVLPVPPGHACEGNCACGAWVGGHDGHMCWKARDDKKVHLKEVHNGQSPAAPARNQRSEILEGSKP